MAEYLKAVPDEASGRLHFVMDREGYEMFARLLARAEPRKADNQRSFKSIKDRVAGAFLAGAVQMGWERQ